MNEKKGILNFEKIDFKIPIKKKQEVVYTTLKLSQSSHEAIKEVAQIQGLKHAEVFDSMLSLFDAFVLPSLSEGLPLTILEAMSAKTPIVATTVGGIPEVLQNGQGGLLVEPKNPKSLADAILKIRNNRALTEQLVFFSHNEVLTKYSSKTMAIKYLEMYKSSCKN